jgi:hypothetical protein
MDSYAVDKAKPLGSWKTAWRTAREQAEVKSRMHDLRHSVVSKLGETDTRGAVIRAISSHSTSGRSFRRNRPGAVVLHAHAFRVSASTDKITFS